MDSNFITALEYQTQLLEASKKVYLRIIEERKNDLFSLLGAIDQCLRFSGGEIKNWKR